MDQAPMKEDRAANGEVFIWDHPVEHLEPETAPADAARDARMMCVLLLNDFAVEILRALTSQNGGGIQHALVRLYGIAYGMGLNVCADVSMTDRADQLGVGRATLSKIGRVWNEAHDLPPSFHQKTAAAITSYAATRRQVVANSGNGNGSSNGTNERVK
jgi:hypothetical protein